MSKFEKKTEKGVAAIEFAIIFPVLFFILYALVTYSLIFVIQHSLTLAAAEGGRAAAQFVSAEDSNNLPPRKKAACVAALHALSWLTANENNQECNGNLGGGLSVQVSDAVCPPPKIQSIHCLEINVAYAYGEQPLIPILMPVPAQLKGDAWTQIALSF